MKTKMFVCSVAILGLAVVLLGVTYVLAGSAAGRLAGVTVPLKMSYQGMLTDPATGQSVPDGDYEIRFALYGAASGGSALWTETQTVSVEDGRFSILLGGVNPLSPEDFTGTTYLGVKVGNDAEMTPRQQVVSVAYAIHAQEAARAPLAAPDFDSDWVDVQAGSAVTITHGLGGDPGDYVVDMTFRDQYWGSGVHQNTYGGDMRPGDVGKGMYWEDLTATSIRVVRMSADVRCQQVRVRIWVYEE